MGYKRSQQTLPHHPPPFFFRYSIFWKEPFTMHFSSLIPSLILLGANSIQATVIAGRAAVDGPCTGSGDAPGVCIATGQCTSGGGTYISNACPGTPDDIKCCTKTSCGSGGNCRWTSQCSTSSLSGLCPGPADFKCCVPAGDGPYPPPTFPAVGACKDISVSSARKVVEANPGKVREIYCTRDCSCPGTSDHCCGLAIDFMCSSAGGVSRLADPPSHLFFLTLDGFPTIGYDRADHSPPPRGNPVRSAPRLENRSRNGP